MQIHLPVPTVSDSVRTNFIFVSLLWFITATAGADPYLPSATGELMLEAEHFDSNVSGGGRDWVTDTLPGFVGDSAMRASPDSFLSVKTNIAGNSPRMDYDVSVPTSTSVYVWVRGYGPSGSADSVWVGLNGNDANAIRIDPTRRAWGWKSSGKKLYIPAGTHTINVWMREDGTIVDRLFLTPSTNAPSGDGGPESTRGGGSPGDSDGQDNTWPVALNDTFSIINDGSSQSLPVLMDNGSGADFDPDGDAISIVSVNDPSSANSIVTINGSADAVFYTPSSDQQGTDTFDYTIEDGNGGSGSATVSIDVNPTDSGGGDSGGGGDGNGSFRADSNGQVVMEAEHFVSTEGRGGRDWVQDFTQGFIGDSAMRAIPNTYLSVKSNIAANSPRMDYAVNYPSRTTVNVWVRGLGPSGSADSIWIGIDGNDANAIRIDPTRRAWGWETSGERLTVPAGEHIINVWMREDGTIVDRLLLTPSSTAPSGTGPDESPRADGNDTDPPLTNDPPPSNSPPSISGAPPADIDVGSGYDFSPTANDTDGDTLVFTVENKPGWMSFDTATGRISGTPGAADVGTHSNISISVSDGIDSAILGPFSVTVNVLALGSATLRWTPPTQNEDGTPLTDLAGFNVYWRTTPGDFSNSRTINDPSATTFVVEGLSPGNYEFVTRAFNSGGVESRDSNVATKTMQ